MADNKTACGYHVLHFIEIEMRRSLGEGEWPCRYDVGKRVRLLQAIWRKFRRPKSVATGVIEEETVDAFFSRYGKRKMAEELQKMGVTEAQPEQSESKRQKTAEKTKRCKGRVDGKPRTRTHPSASWR